MSIHWIEKPITVFLAGLLNEFVYGIFKLFGLPVWLIWLWENASRCMLCSGRLYKECNIRQSNSVYLLCSMLMVIIAYKHWLHFRGYKVTKDSIGAFLRFRRINLLKRSTKNALDNYLFSSSFKGGMRLLTRYESGEFNANNVRPIT